MASKENEDKVNEAIMNMLRRGHPHRGKKMNPPAGEDGELAFRLRKDPPPGYGQPGEASPNYGSKGKEPVTKDKPSIAEKVPVPGGVSEMVFRLREDTPPGYDKPDGLATSNYDNKGKVTVTKEKPFGSEEAPVADDKYKKPADFKLDPSYFIRKRAAAKKTGPTSVRTCSLIYSFDRIANTLKDPDPRRQGQENDGWAQRHCQDRAGGRAGHLALRRTCPDPPYPFPCSRQTNTLSQYDIAQRADALFIKKNLKLRYFHECSEEHFNEFKNLISKGMSVDEACAAHSDFGAWMFIETERERFRS